MTPMLQPHEACVTGLTRGIWVETQLCQFSLQQKSRSCRHFDYRWQSGHQVLDAFGPHLPFSIFQNQMLLSHFAHIQQTVLAWAC